MLDACNAIRIRSGNGDPAFPLIASSPLLRAHR
jgi:hypothetical protein